MSNRYLVWLVCFSLLSATGAMIGGCRRDNPPAAGMPPGMPGMPGKMPMGAGGPGMPGMPAGMPGMPGMPPMVGNAAIATADGFVYVVQGNTLYQFNGRTLKLVNKTEIMPLQERPMMPPPGGMPPAPGE